MNQTAKPTPLGRGLSALFGDADTSYQGKPAPAGAKQAVPAAAPQSGGVTKIAIEKLHPGTFQPRRRFDEDAIKGLSDSIRERGVLQPLLVRPLPGKQGQYEIIAGERRWRASQLAGLHEVPAVVREIPDREALEIGLIENVQREGLSPIEEAEGYQRLMKEFNHTQDGLSKILGKSRPHITNMLRLLTLPAEVKQMIESGDLSMGHARTLVTAKDPLSLAKEIVKKKMSVRQAEALARRESEFAARKGKAVPAANADVQALEKELEKLVGLKVKIHTAGKGGSITFHYQDLDQLDGIIKRLQD